MIWKRSDRTELLGLILVASIVVKLLFILYIDGKFYCDPVLTINFGYALEQGRYSIQTHSLGTKTFLGPILWFEIYSFAGIWGLKVFNLLMFNLLFWTQYLMSRGLYQFRTAVIALFLSAFYVGTHRNVVAGEADDNVAGLLFALAILCYLRTNKIFLPSLLMGTGFVFKFWVAIFCVAFVCFLLTERRWKAIWPAFAGMGIPFLCINLIDRFQSLTQLLQSLESQHRYSSWGSVGFKLLSTGLLIVALLSVWSYLRNRTQPNRLFLVLSIAYPIYMVVMQDAYSASYVGMVSLVFSSFLIAQLTEADGTSEIGMLRPVLLKGMLLAYFVGTSWITYHNLDKDTRPLALRVEQPWSSQ
jgi:hypothetical protein